MKEVCLFSNEKIAENIYVITENYDPGHRFTIGLVVGEKKAAVIDAGLGMAGDLKAYVEWLIGTDREIICLVTHGHSDAVGGAGFFEEVYMNLKDLEGHPESYDLTERINQLGFFSGQNPEIIEYGKAHGKDNSTVAFRDLGEDSLFDLGGVRIEIIPMSGHTKGSVMVRVINKEGLSVTFCGDAFSTGMNHFMTMNGLELKDYGDRLKKALLKLEEREPIYCTHSQVAFTRKVGEAIANAVIEVANGQTENDPLYINPFARGKVQNLRTHYVENNYIVYDGDLVK